MVGDSEFFEIYCKADLAVCEGRDVKGMYQKARSGQITEFTGISSPYEAPEAAELVVETGTKPLDICVDEVIDALVRQGIILAR